MNCAACHTAQLRYGGVETTIDGGPNRLDFQLVSEALDDALQATAAGAAKWDRFATEVLAGRVGTPLRTAPC